MPGHVKLGKTGEPDPDPSPYLVVSMEMKREAMVSTMRSAWNQLCLSIRQSLTTPRSRCGALTEMEVSRNVSLRARMAPRQPLQSAMKRKPSRQISLGRFKALLDFCDVIS